jgi:hypothetical protein
MTANIQAFDSMIGGAICHFWKSRGTATQSQQERGNSDQGGRAAVTAGKNLDKFVEMISQIIVDNGIDDAEIRFRSKSYRTIPGYYRPTKNWDLIVVRKNTLIAAMEFKSQVGPSFGNNFNNRVEESLGNSVDILTAYRKGAFGESSKPFLGYMFVLEKCIKSTSPVRIDSPHFPPLPEYINSSYAQRYEILCRKLVQEQLYDAACLVLTPSTACDDGTWEQASDLTSPKRFVSTLAGMISGMALE